MSLAVPTSMRLASLLVSALVLAALAPTALANRERRFSSGTQKHRREGDTTQLSNVTMRIKVERSDQPTAKNGRMIGGRLYLPAKRFERRHLQIYGDKQHGDRSYT